MDFLTLPSASAPWHRLALEHALRVSAGDVIAHRGWPARPRRRRVDRRDLHPLGMHRDHWPEICIALDGHASLAVEGASYEMVAPRIGLIAPMVAHCEGYSKKNQSYHMLWLMLNRQSALGLVIEYLPKRGWFCSSRHAVKLPAVQQLFDALQDESQLPGPSDLENLRVPLIAVLGQLLWLATQSPSEQTDENGSHTKHRAVLEHLRDQLDHHFERPFDLEQLAQKTRLTPRYIARLFKQWTGQSVHHYQIQQRMNHAQKLCEQTNLLVKEIAMRVGYDDPFYFSRAFHHFHGHWPNDHRGNR